MIELGFNMKFEIVSFKSVGPIEFGMSERQLYAAFGKADDVQRNTRPEVECYYPNVIVRLNKEMGVVNEVTFFSDPSIELYLGDVSLDWSGAFVPDLCDLDGDPREALGYICLHNLGLMLVDFFDGDIEPAITVASTEMMNKIINDPDPVLDMKVLKKKMKKVGVKPR